MAKIDTFRANLAGGGARPSQFEVNLIFPFWVQDGSGASSAGKFLINAATLPSSVISSIEVPFRGRIAKIAGERQFANWNVTVLNDNDFYIRRALERWSKGILEHSETKGMVSPNSYTTQMQVHQLDRNDRKIKSYQFYNCFPQNIQEIQLDFGATSRIEEFQVEFSVDYWETDEAINAGGISDFGQFM